MNVSREDEARRIIRALLRVVRRMTTLPDSYHRCATCDAVRRAERYLGALSNPTATTEEERG